MPKQNIIDMESTTCFSQGQMHILQLMKYCNTEGAIEELDSIISKYYEEKLQKEVDKLWDEGTLNADAIENILSEDLHTPYNNK